MGSLLERISFLRPDVWDLAQIAIVAYIFYRLLLLWAGSRAIQMLLGLTVLFGVYVIAGVLQLELIRYLLEVVFTYGAFAAIVVFQPELRSALTKLGQSRFFRYLSRIQQTPETVEGMAAAAEQLSRSKVGAIIAVERDVSPERVREMLGVKPAPRGQKLPQSSDAAPQGTGELSLVDRSSSAP